MSNRAAGRIRDLLACLLVAGVGLDCSGHQLSDQVFDRVNRLRAIVPLAGEFKDQRDRVFTALADVESAARAGQSYFALYRLQSLWTSVQPVEYARSRASIEKEGLARFQREWRSLAPQLKAQETRIDRSMPARLPRAIRGLIEMCLTKSRAYYESSRAFGVDTQLKGGLYYMGVASAELDFAELCLKQDFSGHACSLGFRSLDPELRELDARVVETYKQRDSPQLVEEFIALSSNVEFAANLERAGRHDGALIAYLDATLNLGLLENAAGDAAAPAESAAGLRARLDEIARRLQAAGVDHSVALIYSTMAQRALDRAAGGPQPAEELKKAKVLIEQVLPTCLNAILETKR